MNKRYTADLQQTSEPTNLDQHFKIINAVDGETDNDLIIVLLDQLFGSITIECEQHFKSLYTVSHLKQSRAVGMANTVRGSMFEPVWEALQQPDNAEFNVKFEDSDLPKWYVRFKTTDQMVHVTSCELNVKFYSLLLRKLNELLEARAGLLEITELSTTQFQHFIKLMFKQLRDM